MFRICFLALLVATPLEALTVAEAQRCADDLIAAYRKKHYPAEILNVPAIISSAVGPRYRGALERDKETFMRVGYQILKESFEQPTGKYQFFSITVDDVHKHTKAVGRVDMKTPKGTGEFSFEAITDASSCFISAVTIGSVTSLRSQVSDELNKDSRTANLMNANKK